MAKWAYFMRGAGIMIVYKTLKNKFIVKKYILFLLSMMCAVATIAQTRQLTGKVVDKSDNAPLAGANIEIKNGKGTVTDQNGNFSLTCSSDSVRLRISYVGYETLVKAFACGDKNMLIALKPNAKVLNQVEITATSIPNRSQLEQPSSIVAMQPRQLKRGIGLYLAAAINTNVPGVIMERRTVSGGQQFNIRGYGNGVGSTRFLNSNFDGQGVKVYLNGIPITDAEGITVMDDIDFASIRKVEISKGPSGTLYGMAIAGVINMQTRKAVSGETSVGQNFTFGSYGLFRSTTRIAIGKKKSSLLVNYGYQDYKGFIVHTASHKDFINVIGDFDLNKKETVSTYFGFADSYDQRQGELTMEQYNTFDYSGNPAYIKNNAHSAVRTFRAGLRHTYQFNDNISNTTTFFGSSQNMDNSSAAGWTDKTPLNYGFRSTFNMQFNLAREIKLSGITGLEMQKENTLANGYSMVTDSTNPTGYHVMGNVKSIQATTSATASYFTQWTLGLPENFSVTAGVGYSTMALSLQNRLWSAANNYPGSDVPKEYLAHYNDMWAPSFAVNKKIGNSVSVYASYSTGYKAPVSSYFYIPYTGLLNTGLKPEKGSQIEVGTKGSLENNRLFYSLALFHVKFAHKMTAVAVQDPLHTMTLYTYIVNGGSLDNKGIEMLLKYDAYESRSGFMRSVRPFANFTYSFFKYENFVYETVGTGVNGQDSLLVHNYSGNREAGVPPVTFNAGVDFDTGIGLYGNVTYNYRDYMYITSDEKYKTSPYNLLNAKLGFRKQLKHFDFDVYFAANNITGTQYYEMVFINQVPDVYLPAPYKINFYGGINLKYKF